MKRIIAFAIAGTVVVGLSACGARHATLEDCVNTYDALGKPTDISVVVCGNMLTEVATGDRSQQEFDDMFLPK